MSPRPLLPKRVSSSASCSISHYRLGLNGGAGKRRLLSSLPSDSSDPGWRPDCASRRHVSGLDALSIPKRTNSRVIQATIAFTGQIFPRHKAFRPPFRLDSPLEQRCGDLAFRTLTAELSGIAAVITPGIRWVLIGSSASALAIRKTESPWHRFRTPGHPNARRDSTIVPNRELRRRDLHLLVQQMVPLHAASIRSFISPVSDRANWIADRDCEWIESHRRRHGIAPRVQPVGPGCGPGSASQD